MKVLALLVLAAACGVVTTSTADHGSTPAATSSEPASAGPDYDPMAEVAPHASFSTPAP